MIIIYNELKDLFMQHNKTIYLPILLIFSCTNSYSSESETVLRSEPNSRTGLKFICSNGQSVSEIHFKKTEFSKWIFEKGGEGSTGGNQLYVDIKELEKHPSQMKISLDYDRLNCKHDSQDCWENSPNDWPGDPVIPANDPLRNDDSLFVNLNTVVTRFLGDKKAKKRLYELTSQGASLSSCYLISICYASPRKSPFLMIEKPLKSEKIPFFDRKVLRKSKKGIFSDFLIFPYFLIDNDADTLCTAAQGRDARNIALKKALNAGGLLLPDLITLIQSFDENSPEELAEIQKIREKIYQERQNKITLGTLITEFKPTTARAWFVVLLLLLNLGSVV